MTDATVALLRRLEASVTEEYPPEVEVLERRPFRAWLNPATPLVWLNYAMPVEALGTVNRVADAVSQLRQDFAIRRRVLRFEFTEELWPDLPSLVESSGLVVQTIQPLMACWPFDLRPYAGPLVSIVPLNWEHADSLVTFQRIQIRGFGEDFDDGSDPTSPSSVANLAARLRSGHAVAVLGLLDGAPVGAGALTANGNTGELVGIATVPEGRRRGVAATVSSYLVNRYFRQGGEIAWLSAGDQAAQKVYEKIGFRVVGSLLNYIDSRPAPLSNSTSH